MRAKVVMVGLVIVAIVIGIQLALAQKNATNTTAVPAGPTGQPTTSAPLPPAESPASSPSGGSSSETTTSRAPRTLTGEALAKAWLTGYLNRPEGRDSAAWQPEVRDITSPELMTLLEKRGANLVGLFKLNTWKVTKIVPYKGKADVGASGPSRQVLAYTATVTDGKQSMDKPFILTAYAGKDGRFLVSIVEQPYTSEG